MMPNPASDPTRRRPFRATRERPASSPPVVRLNAAARAFWAVLRYAALNEVTLLERLPKPSHVPVLYVASHRNGMVDALPYLAAVPKALPLIAAQWHKHALARWLFPGIAVFRTKERAGGIAGDNDAALESAASALTRRELVLVFPEGTSALGPKHLPFHKGAARILAQALKHCSEVMVVPLAVFYEEAWAWQSRVEVVVGSATVVKAEAPTAPADALQNHGQRVADLHAKVSAMLESCLVEFDNGQEQEDVEALAYAATLGRNISYAAALRVLARVVSPELRAQWQTLRAAVLERGGLLHQGVPLLPVGGAWLYRLAWLLFAPLVGAAALANFPVVLAGRYGAHHFPDERNVVALWRLLLGVPAALIWAPLVAAGLVWLAPWWSAPLYVGISVLGLRLWHRFRKLSVAAWNSFVCAPLKDRLLALHGRLGSLVTQWQADA